MYLNNSVYYVFAGAVYGCIALILAMSLFFGLRAKRNVSRESISSLPDGMSPLDIQRIFIGKTYPRRLTKALIAYWAKCGFIRLKFVSKNTVRVIKLKDMPTHINKDAVFFDRGTYVRERGLYKCFIKKIEKKNVIDLRKPLFTRNEVSRIYDWFAVREDEGVFSSKHYSLKVFTLVLSIIPFALCEIWIALDSGDFVSLILIGTAVIGLFVFMFVHEMPIPFKIIWCGMWLGMSVGITIMFFQSVYDPFGIIYAAVAILFGGSLGFIRFVDYREKNNLKDYSDIVNYRKFLLRTPVSELNKLDYITVLPYLYAFNIKWFAARKFNRTLPPEIYVDDPDGKGALL